MISFLKRLLPLLALLSFSALHSAGIGYAFSGGGARGYAHIGILKVLEENGIKPDYISGTSIGALVGGLYAMGYSAAEIEDIALKLDFDTLFDDSFRRGDLYIGQKRWGPYGNVVLELDDRWSPRFPSGVIAGNNVNLIMAEIYAPASGTTDFSALPVPFACVATNLVNGDEVVFRSGSLMQAIRASISIPSLVRPFDIGADTFIDGGISQNLPLSQVRAMGADAVIGMKVNSSLRGADRLVNLVDVLDQTINIGMTRNVNQSISDCELLLQPLLEQFSASDYHRVAEIIAAGELYARENLDKILAFKGMYSDPGSAATPAPKLILPDAYHITRIDCEGNLSVSDAKVIEYLALEPGQSYSIKRIVAACRAAWNSQAFHTVYPVLRPGADGYVLEVNVRERERRLLALNFTYSTEEALNAGSVLALNNLLMKNSTLLASLTLGGRTELNLDYVKNFGELWGAYFRLFPYLTEQKRYYYDSEFHKVASANALEYGFTAGVGIFANRLAIGEAFLYSFQTKLYRDVSAVAPVSALTSISGVGIKLKHESLDDYVFPTSGVRASLKLNFSRWEAISDHLYNKALANIELYTPIGKVLSAKIAARMGSYFGEDEFNFDPFYFCGSNGYLGYGKHEVSAPIYKIYDLGLVFNPARNIYLQTGVQGLNVSNVDVWSAEQEVEWDVYAGFGYKSPIGPMRFTAAIREHSEVKFYLNMGFDLDIFEFSRH